MSVQMRKHLLDKEKLAKEHVSRVGEHIQKLTETYRELQSALTRARGKVETEFRNLQTILHQKKETVLQKLDTSVSTQQETVRSYTQHAEKVTVDVTKALDCAHVLASEKNQKSFYAGYSTVAQSLEQAVVDMLLLGEYVHLSEDISCGAKTLGSMELDVGVSIHTTDTLEAIIDDVFCPHGDEKEEDKEDCKLLAKACSTEVEESLTTSSRWSSESGNSSEGRVPARLQYMELTEGCIIQVLITSVRSPSEFCAQPYCPLLIELKDQISSFYRDLTAKNVKKFVVPPAVGDYCCARFSEDRCWYRAIVTAVDRSSGHFQGKKIHSNVWVSIVYVDYGNEETLPLSELRQLDCSFSSLPCQALYCSMPRIKPCQSLASPPCHDRVTQVWPASVCRWFGNVMLGKLLHISVISGDKQNNCEVDVHVPWDILCNQASLKSLPRPPKCVLDKGKSQSSPVALSLANFMVSVGLGVTCTSSGSSCGVQTEPCEEEDTIQTGRDNCLQKDYPNSLCRDCQCEFKPSADRKSEMDTDCEFARNVQAATSSGGNEELKRSTSNPLDAAVILITEASSRNRSSVDSIESSDMWGTGNGCIEPSQGGSIEPSQGGSIEPSQGGSIEPSQGGSIEPSQGGSIEPSQGGSIEPSQGGSIEPSQGGSIEPSQGGSIEPSQGGSIEPSQGGSIEPSQGGSIEPSQGGFGGTPRDDQKRSILHSQANSDVGPVKLLSSSMQADAAELPSTDLLISCKPDTAALTKLPDNMVELLRSQLKLFPGHIAHCSGSSGEAVRVPVSLSGGVESVQDYAIPLQSKEHHTDPADGQLNVSECNSMEEQIPELSPCSTGSPDKFIGTMDLPVSMEAVQYQRSLFLSEFPCKAGSCNVHSTNPVVGENESQTVASAPASLLHSDGSCSGGVEEGSFVMEDEKLQLPPPPLGRPGAIPGVEEPENKCTITTDDMLQQQDCLIKTDIKLEPHRSQEGLDFEAKCSTTPEIDHKMAIMSHDEEEPLVSLEGEMKLHGEASRSESECRLQSSDKELQSDSFFQLEGGNKFQRKTSQEEHEMELKQATLTKLKNNVELQIESMAKTGDGLSIVSSSENRLLEIETEDNTETHLTKSEDEKECCADNLTTLNDLKGLHINSVSDVDNGPRYTKAESKDELQIGFLAISEQFQSEQYQSSVVDNSQVGKELHSECISSSETEQDSVIIKAEKEMELQESGKAIQNELCQSLLLAHSKELHFECISTSEIEQDLVIIKSKKKMELQEGGKQFQTDTLVLLAESQDGSGQGPDFKQSVSPDICKSADGHSDSLNCLDTLGIKQSKVLIDSNGGMQLQLETTTKLEDREEFQTGVEEIHQIDSLNKLGIVSVVQSEYTTSSDNEKKLQPEVRKELQPKSFSNPDDADKLLIDTLTTKAEEDGKCLQAEPSFKLRACNLSQENEFDIIHSCTDVVGQRKGTCVPLIIDLDKASTTCEVDKQNASSASLPLSGIVTHLQAIAPQDNCSPKAAIDLLSWQSLGQSKPICLGVSGDFTVLVSHVNSPSQFYVHPVQPDTAHELDQLISSMSAHYSVEENSIPLHRLQYDVGTVCCVRSAYDGLWYRGIVMERDVYVLNNCNVLFVDYGDTQLVDKDSVFVLDQMFVNAPVQCICCSLCGVRPLLSGGATDRTIALGKERNNGIVPVPSHVWPLEVNASFESMVNGKQLVAYVANNSGQRCFQNSWMQQVVVEVNLFDTSGESDIDIGTLLVMQGAADWSEEDGVSMQHWNPMESDFLNRRNNYKIDDEDAQLALHGYNSTSSRPCRFFNTPQGCARGNRCTFSHLKEGQCDRQLEETFIRDCGTVEMTLPSAGDWVVVLVTAVISPTRFFVQLPLGNRNPFTYSQRDYDSVEESSWYETVELLIEDMSQHYNSKAFSDIEVFEPHLGEIVAARYSIDEQWYRARVANVLDKSVQVFFVDFGNVEMVSPGDIRSILDKFMHCPFQALECSLSNLVVDSKSPVMPCEAKELFVNLVTDHLLVAEVLWRGYGDVLGLNLFYAEDSDGATEQHLNKLLVKKGIARWIEESLVTITDDVKLFPG